MLERRNAFLNLSSVLKEWEKALALASPPSTELSNRVTDISGYIARSEEERLLKSICHELFNHTKVNWLKPLSMSHRAAMKQSCWLKMKSNYVLWPETFSRRAVMRYSKQRMA